MTGVMKNTLNFFALSRSLLGTTERSHLWKSKGLELEKDAQLHYMYGCKMNSGVKLGLESMYQDEDYLRPLDPPH